jgi:hypothetical protein
MKVRLSDPGLVGDLLRFLRERGCIAYVVDDFQTIEVVRPHAVGAAEEAEVRSLVQEWQLANPGAAVQIDG